MRSFRHWTPRYIKNRIKTLRYEKAHPGEPWLTWDAIDTLDSFLIKTDVGLEFGSGRSTLWFAKRLAHLTSVEHNAVWAEKVRGMLQQAGINNVDYKLVPEDVDEANGKNSAYAKVAQAFPDQSLDFCLVDGVYRDACAWWAIDKIKPGGLLVIDNVNWYLPSKTRTPASRSLQAGAKDASWTQIEQRLATWRRIWTTTGVTDTAIFIKRC